MDNPFNYTIFLAKLICITLLITIYKFGITKSLYTFYKIYNFLILDGDNKIITVSTPYSQVILFFMWISIIILLVRT